MQQISEAAFTHCTHTLRGLCFRSTSYSARGVYRYNEGQGLSFGTRCLHLRSVHQSCDQLAWHREDFRYEQGLSVAKWKTSVWIPVVYIDSIFDIYIIRIKQSSFSLSLSNDSWRHNCVILHTGGFVLYSQKWLCCFHRGAGVYVTVKYESTLSRMWQEREKKHKLLEGPEG